MEGLVESNEPPEMDEESVKTSDQNHEDMQGSISELCVKLEEDRKASVELEATIRSQRKRNSDLKREKQLLRAVKDSIDGDIKEMQKQRSEISCFLSGSQVANLMNNERAKLRKQQRALEEQREEYRLALDSCCQDLDKRWMDIEQLEGSIEEFHTLIQELRAKNKDLEVQLANAVVFGEPHVEQSKTEELELPHSCVEVCDVEEEQITPEVETKEKEPSLNIEVQTKSWWRQQAERVWKVVKRMGTSCLNAMRCLGLRTCVRNIIRSNQVHPVCDDVLPV